MQALKLISFEIVLHQLWILCTERRESGQIIQQEFSEVIFVVIIEAVCHRHLQI